MKVILCGLTQMRHSSTETQFAAFAALQSAESDVFLIRLPPFDRFYPRSKSGVGKHFVEKRDLFKLLPVAGRTLQDCYNQRNALSQGQKTGENLSETKNC